MMLIPAMLEKSIIISAHPDDEVLWFSSVLDKVNKIVICLVNNESRPRWNIGRRKSLAAYPLKTLSVLDIDQAEVFNGGDWDNPVATEYGIEIANKMMTAQGAKYRANYEKLMQQLETYLTGCLNVFTHNPWGEYGHEEHIQVYRAVKSLQGKLKFNLWFSNYVSNKSFKLMLSHADRFHFEYASFETNKALAHDIMRIYKMHKCWTWYDHWEWYPKESFIQERDFEHGDKKLGNLFPTNLIKVSLPPVRKGKTHSYYSMIGRTMKKLVKEILRKFGVEIRPYTPNVYEKMVSLEPETKRHGNVLISYHIKPFLLKPGEPVPNSHTSQWRCLQIARTFVDLGYSVDVIDSHNHIFQPKKPYALFVGHRINFDRVAGLLNHDCIKIAHLDTAHWIYNNYATYQRKFELQQRRGITIKGSDRIVEQTLALEHADYVTVCGNDFNVSTLRYSGKPIYKLPQTPPAVYPWPEDKEFSVCRANFLWFGSHAFVHKGLDLVLEAFAEMPDCHLYVYGPLKKEEEFIEAYHKELYQTPNIHAVGWVDVESPEFTLMAKKCLGIVYPSCSEAGGANVIVCMHAGLIPLVSYESSVDVEDFGVMFKENTVHTIKSAVQAMSNLPAGQLQQMARKAWEYARAHHTREKFTEEYKKLVLSIVEKAKSNELEQYR
jgi:glycosyltransferase involved in cell wall biosynthesis